MLQHWSERGRPARLERRIEFENYELTRDFLDRIAEVSEREGYYPDLNFARTHVSMTVYIDEKNGLEVAQRHFVEAVDSIAPNDQVLTPIEGTVSAHRS